MIRSSLKNLAHLLIKVQSSKKEKTVKKQVIKPSSGKPVKRNLQQKRLRKQLKRQKII